MATRGSREWKRATDRLLDKLLRAAEHATNDGLGIVERNEKRMLRTSTHPPGTPTPSAPGEPPSLVTGNLRRSWKTTPAVRVSTYRVRGKGGPTAVQSRIQELGGTIWRTTSRGHLYRIKLPKRPYLKPALDMSVRDIREAYRRRYQEVILATR